MITPYQSFFQDPFTVIAYQSIELHDLVFYYIIIVLVFVLYFTVKPCISTGYGLPIGPNLIVLEVVWTLVPTLILLAIIYPSMSFIGSPGTYSALISRYSYC